MELRQEKEEIMAERLSHEEFIRKAILSLRQKEYKGIHSVYSGFNEAFKKYFVGEDPVKATTALAKENKVVIRPVRGGVMLYLPEDAPAQPSSERTAEETLKKMGI